MVFGVSVIFAFEPVKSLPKRKSYSTSSWMYTFSGKVFVTLFVPLNVKNIVVEPTTGVSCPVTETMKVLGCGVIVTWSLFGSNFLKVDVLIILAAQPESFRAVIGIFVDDSEVEISS